MQNFRLIFSLVSEIDAFKETYRGAILCIFLKAHDFPQILDGCKFRTVKDRNLKFSGNAQQLICCNAHSKEHLTVHYGWSGNATKTSKIYSFICERPILAFCFALLGLTQNCDFLPTINHVPTLLTTTEKFDITASDIYLLVSKITKNVSKHTTSSAFLAMWDW